jgi:arylsulfatase A-like enzyme
MRNSYSYMPYVPNISDTELDKETITIPEALQPYGYVSAHFGKWHMYNDPGAHGYVEHDGDTDNKPGSTIQARTKKGQKPLMKLPKDLTDPKLMFSITERANNFMESQVEAKKSFYLQVSHYGMHEFRECLPATREKYVNNPFVQAYYKEHKTTAEKINYKRDPAVWLGMGENLDTCIGKVLDKIEALGIADNTYVVLVSDNGYRHEFLPELTQPLHAKKWWAWNGGIRVPMLVKGPGIKSGSVFKGNVINYDFLPTFVDWAGGNPDKLKDIDGVSLAGYMAGKTAKKSFLNRNLYFHYPHYRTSVPHSAVISGSSKVMHFYEQPNIPMLFDLSTDYGEVRNIAKINPAVHKKLYDEMMDYYKLVGARFPKVNVNYDAEKYLKDKNTKYRLKWGAFEGERNMEEDEKVH